MKTGMIKCSVCHSKLVNPSTKAVSRAYDQHRGKVSSKQRVLNFLLVGGDCVLVGLQPVLVFMSKVDGQFLFSPISVNFLTEVAKVIFAIAMLIFQARRQKAGEKPLLSVSTFVQAARSNMLLAVPALLYAVNNYLKFIMQLYFNPATVKMLSNLKWEALALLLIGISINQLKSLPEDTSALALPVTTVAYVHTLTFVTVPSLASVFNEYALKSQYDTSIYLQNLFLYGYGAIFNFLGILGSAIFKGIDAKNFISPCSLVHFVKYHWKHITGSSFAYVRVSSVADWRIGLYLEGPSSFHILEGHSKATILLICNNAAQGILSSFFFKYADAILKRYSSTVATIFTGIASAVMFGHKLTINFLLGISVVFISMHQFFSPLAKAKDDQRSVHETVNVQDDLRSKELSFLEMAAGANEEASHHVGADERQPLLPT